MMIIFTRGDSLVHHKTTVDEFVKECPEFLKELISKCNNRYLAVNNLANGEERTTQQQQILQVISRIITENKDQYYSNAVYAALTDKLQARLQAQQAKETTVARPSFLDSIKQRIIDNQDEILDFVQEVVKVLAGIGIQLFISKMSGK